jgi:hypothetical protein
VRRWCWARALEALAARIADLGGEAAYAPTDVRRHEDRCNLVKVACERYGTNGQAILVDGARRPATLGAHVYINTAVDDPVASEPTHSALTALRRIHRESARSDVA